MNVKSYLVVVIVVVKSIFFLTLVYKKPVNTVLTPFVLFYESWFGSDLLA